MKFEKNIQFTKTIKADNRLREFNFRKLGGIEESIFTVDVVDDRGNRIMFRMKKNDNEWRIVSQSLPEWVLKNEKNFYHILQINKLNYLISIYFILKVKYKFPFLI